MKIDTMSNSAHPVHPIPQSQTTAQERDEKLAWGKKQQQETQEKEILRQKLLALQEKEHQTDPLPKIISDVERDLLFEILWNMRHSKISLETSHQLAKEFLLLLPVHDQKELLDKLLSLGEKYPEAQSVYVKHAAPLEQAERNAILAQLSQHIKSGNLEHALTLVKEKKQR